MHTFTKLEQILDFYFDYAITEVNGNIHSIKYFGVKFLPDLYPFRSPKAKQAILWKFICMCKHTYMCMYVHMENILSILPSKQ